MQNITFKEGPLNEKDQQRLADGFTRVSIDNHAPTYEKKTINWLIHDDQGQLISALTAKLLWDWLYIDELWVDETLREQGMGSQLIHKAEAFARAESLTGLWLWTQSWYAEGFYKKQGYDEFTRFEDFPKGHARIGLRKLCTKL